MAEEALNALLVRGFAECWWPGVDEVVDYNWADLATVEDRDDLGVRVALASVDYAEGGMARYAR